MVTVAVIAEKATVEPMTAYVIEAEVTQTCHAALTAILRFESLRKKALNGGT
jgi:hypothetical protein